MISNPEQYLPQYRDAGAEILTIHIEPRANRRRCYKQIRELGAGVGLALNPPTPVSAIEPFLKQCDLVLPMSVMPGFGGQKFDPTALDKLRWLRDWSASESAPALTGSRWRHQSGNDTCLC